MAIAPLRSLSHSLPPQARPPRPVPTSAPEARAIAEAGHQARGQARALEDELEAQKAASLELRLIRAMLLKEKPELAEAESRIAGDADAELTVEQTQSQSVAISLDGPTASLDIEMEQSQSLSMTVSVDAEGETRIEFRLEQRQEIRVELNGGAPAPAGKKDPLVLDLDGDGLETSGLIAGQVFDIDGDGRAERVSVASGGDAFLALDRDGNGRIDDGRELFGDQNGAESGFAELARHDGNGDGRIDALDPVYSRLSLLRFDGDDQVIDSLAEAGIASIELAYRQDGSALANGDLRVQQGAFRFADGRSGEASDLLVHFQALA